MDTRIRQLLNACEHGDSQTVEALLDQGLPVEVSDDDDVTPLQVACANGQECVVRLLLMRGATLDTTNGMGWTPLMQAARYGHSTVVALLLQNKADINARNRLNTSALTLASRGGHVPTVRLLLEAGINPDSSGSLCEFTPVLAAAQHGHDAVLRLLLDRVADVNYRTSSGAVTPLMLASLNGHMTTAQILIERGADPNTVTVDGKTALEIASLRGKKEVMGYLDRKTTNKPALAPEDIKPDIIEAAKHSNLQRIREILARDITRRDACSPQDGATPLMFAAMTGRLDIAHVLIESGCDLNKQDVISGWTALMQAIYHGKKGVAMSLINAGGDVTIQARNGCTAFDMASLINDDTELLRLLAAKMLHVNKVEKQKSKRSGRNSGTLPAYSSEEHPKSGLKAWWSRMSNRFRNLKLGRTFMLPNSRLAPMDLESLADPNATLRSDVSSVKSSPMDYGNNMRSASSMLNLTTTTSAASSASSATITSYETMLMETKKSAAMYTLDINPPHSSMTGTETLKPVVPPFLPLPTFDLGNGDRTKMPLSGRKSEMLDGSSAMRPVKFPRTRPSVMGSTPVTPLTSHRYRYGNISPSSSGGSSGVKLVNKSTPDLTADPLYAVPPPGSSRTNRPFMSRSGTVAPMFKAKTNTTSPNSSTSSSATPQRSSQGRSTSSKESTASTLTPSPSPVPKYNKASIAMAKIIVEEYKLLQSKLARPLTQRPVIAYKKNKSLKDLLNGNKTDSTAENTEAHDDELAGILKKLSMERYNPIFEEQEVDMEAFLTLTDSDLAELGINNQDSRREILSAITELNSGKGRERQHFHDTMTSFQSNLTSKLPLTPGSEAHKQLMMALNNSREATDNSLIPSAKSRSS